MATTKYDLDQAFRTYARACTSAGVDTTNYRLTAGSAANGIAYRVMDRDPISGGLSSPIIGGDFLGFTRKDATMRLYVMAEAIADTVRFIEERAATL